jgi:hypothetical protein
MRLLPTWLGRVIICAFGVYLTACAFKNTGDVGFSLPDKVPWAEDLYSRNAVVAAPTLVGNAAGALVGIPLYLSVAGIERAVGHKDESVADVALLVPIYLGGAVTGTPFLPIAMALPEDRWIMGPSPDDFEVQRALSRIENANARAETAVARAEHYSRLASDAARRAEEVARSARSASHQAEQGSSSGRARNARR